MTQVTFDGSGREPLLDDVPAPHPHARPVAGATSPNPASPLLHPTSGPSSTSPAAAELPPTFRKQHGEKPRLSDEDVARVRQLRREDTKTWTRGRLAKEFNCTPWFVGKIIALKGPDRRRALEERERAHEAARAKWGERKSLQMDIRKKRKEFW